MDDESNSEMMVMPSDSLLDDQVITLYDSVISDIDNGIFGPLQPANIDMDTTLDLTGNSLSEFVPLAPADIPPKSYLVNDSPDDILRSSEYSPSSSSFSWSSPENPESVSYSPSSNASGTEECIDFLISPSDVIENQIPPKKKRGRKPKSADGSYIPTSKTVKTKRLKAYEINMPFQDKELERKRVNAIKAKKHRESQKKTMLQLQQHIEGLKAVNDKLRTERDSLKREVHSLRLKDYDAERELQNRELENERRQIAEIKKKYEVYKRNWESQVSRIMNILQNAPEF